MALHPDPTRTKGIRNRWTSQFNKRYRQLRGRTSRFLNAAEGPFDPLFIDFFNVWLANQVNELLFEFVQTPPPHWQNQYIDQAYARGLTKSQKQIRRSDPDFRSSADTAVISLLYTRAYEDLKGVTNEMQAQMSRVLTQGILAEDSKAKIIKSVNNRVNKIGLTRSKIISRTQAVSTYNTAVIENLKASDSQTGDVGKLLWITQGDERVRTTHALRNEKLYTPKAAFNLINEPNCRCELQAVTGTELQALESASGSKKRTQIRKAGLAESDQATTERRFRTTLDRARRAEGLAEG